MTRPGARLVDNIWVKGAESVSEWKSQAGRPVEEAFREDLDGISDHYPVVADIRFPTVMKRRIDMVAVRHVLTAAALILLPALAPAGEPVRLDRNDLLQYRGRRRGKRSP